MTKKKKTEDAECCDPSTIQPGKCCNIESLITVDERGQMVLPKSLRDKAGINAGDKLAVITMGEGSKVCCITLIKVEDLNEMAKNVLGPMLKGVL